MEQHFRKLVGSVIALYGFYILNPILLPRTYSEEIREAYSWLGYGAALDPFSPVMYILAFGMITSLIGVYQYQKTARSILLIMYGIYIFSIPLLGIAVIGPFDGLLSTLIFTGVVSVIVVSYTTLEHRFENGK